MVDVRSLALVLSLGAAAVCASCSAGPAPARPKPLSVATPPPPAPSGDASSPDYYLGRIEQPEWRDRSVLRLSQMLENVRAQADARLGEKEAAKDPDLAALVERCVGPLTKAYAEHRDELSPQARRAATAAMLAMKDPRAERALLKAATLLAEYAEALPSSPPIPSDDYPDKDDFKAEIEPALQAYASLGLPSLSQPLLRAYVALHQRDDIEFCELATAMAGAPQGPWADEMLAALGRLSSLEDEGYNRCWREAALRILAKLGDQRAASALLRLLAPGSSPHRRWRWDRGHLLAETVLIAVVSDELAAELLAGDREAARSVAIEPGQDAVIAGAWLLGTIGNPESQALLERALARQRSPKARAAIVRALVELPGSPGSHATIRKALADLSRRSKPAAFLDGNDFPPRVFDPGLVETILRWVKELKGRRARQEALASAMLLMDAKHVAAVERAAAGETDEEIRQILQDCRELVERCQEHVDCYEGALREALAAERTRETRIKQVKALYMLGVYGNAQAIVRVFEGNEALKIEGQFLTLVVDELATVRSPKLEVLLEQHAIDDQEVVERTLARLRRRPEAR